MNKFAFVFIFLLCVVDFFVRILPSDAYNKPLNLDFEVSEVYVHSTPEIGVFNPHLFGEIVETKVDKKIEEKPVKEKELEFKPIVRAIYSKSEPYVLVAKNDKEVSTKLTLGQYFQGYQLTAINKDSIIFNKDGIRKEFRIFKK